MADLDQYLPSIAAGDPDAFARWVAGVEDRVRRSLSSVAVHVDVEAVVQETLLRVWQVAPRVQPDGRANALLRLAIRIARNLALSELRKRRARPEVIAALPALEVAGPEPQLPDPRLREVIATCKGKLPGKPALALAARLRPVAEPDVSLAAALGMTLNTFLQNVTRARKLLAACLARHGIDLATELR